MAFALHHRLAGDCEKLADWALCTVLLMRDHRFPWMILVPRLSGLRDLHDLPRDQAPTLFDEIATASRVLINDLGAEKVNVAALGNQVPQLHIHVIGRHGNDAAWPGPVWNAGAVTAVDVELVNQRAATLRQVLNG